MRGGGNYSLRLYETLCLGRIPLFINTDCVLPFENNIDWKELCLWVDENDLDRIGEIVLDFHSSISKKSLRISNYMQEKCGKNIYLRKVLQTDYICY